MSRLSDQVEAKIARANRAFRLSSRVIAAAHRELESHAAWLDRHRASWAEEVKRHHRLFKRKLAMRAVMRFAVDLLFAAPFALARALAPRLEVTSLRSSGEPRPSRTEPTFTRHAALQLRIRGLDERSGPTQTDAPQFRTERSHEPTACSPLGGGGASFTPAPRMRARTRHVPIAAVGTLALLIVAIGVLRLMFSSTPENAPERAAQEVLDTEAHVAAATLIVEKPAPPPEPPAPASGFAVLDTPPSTEALAAPPQTIADMVAMAMAEPLPSPSAEAEAAPAPMAEAPLPPKRAAKAKPKRKVAAREPEPLPWWQQWSWIRVR